MSNKIRTTSQISVTIPNELKNLIDSLLETPMLLKPAKGAWSKLVKEALIKYLEYKCKKDVYSDYCAEALTAEDIKRIMIKDESTDSQ